MFLLLPDEDRASFVSIERNSKQYTHHGMHSGSHIAMERTRMHQRVGSRLGIPHTGLSAWVEHMHIGVLSWSPFVAEYVCVRVISPFGYV